MRLVLRVFVVFQHSVLGLQTAALLLTALWHVVIYTCAFAMRGHLTYIHVYLQP